jgi:chromosome segregation ATPase
MGALIESEAEQLAHMILRLENLIMATKADLERSLAGLSTAVDGVKQQVNEARSQLTALGASFDAFKAEDATEDDAYEARIADLQRQLTEAQGTLDGAVTAIDAMAAAVKA